MSGDRDNRDQGLSSQSYVLRDLKPLVSSGNEAGSSSLRHPTTQLLEIRLWYRTPGTLARHGVSPGGAEWSNIGVRTSYPP